MVDPASYTMMPPPSGAMPTSQDPALYSALLLVEMPSDESSDPPILFPPMPNGPAGPAALPS
jgi:hypothetical protein